MPFLDDPVTAVSALPALPLLLPLFVLVSALLEYVVPPYWGDMFMLVGFFLAGQPTIPVSPWTIFAAALTGSVIGSIVAFLLGRRYGLALTRRLVPWHPSGSHQRIHDLFRRYGERFLLVNRFMPVIRGLLLYGAGAMRLRFKDSVIYSTLSNLIWVSILMGVGLLASGSWDDIMATFRQTNRLLGTAVTVAAAGWIAVLFWRYRFRQERI